MQIHYGTIRNTACCWSRESVQTHYFTNTAWCWREFVCKTFQLVCASIRGNALVSKMCYIEQGSLDKLKVRNKKVKMKNKNENYHKVSNSLPL